MQRRPYKQFDLVIVGDQLDQAFDKNPEMLLEGKKERGGVKGEELVLKAAGRILT